MATPILNITEVQSNQVDQFAVYNEALRKLEAAANDFKVFDLSLGDLSITANEFHAFFMFRVSGNVVARDLIFPANKRNFAVHNAGSAELSVKLGATTLALAAGSSALYYSDGTADGIMKIG